MFGVHLRLIVLCTGTPGNAAIHKYMNAKKVPQMMSKDFIPEKTNILTQLYSNTRSTYSR